MNLKEQLYVCTLAKCGTISKAAEELYISPPALSVYLSNLEKYLGVRLFERTGKSLVPTSMGREYVERAEKMLQMKKDFELLLEQSSGKCKGSLRGTAERILEQYRIRPKRIIEIRYFETAMSMVDQGVGIGFNRSGYIRGMDRFPGVRYCLIGDVPYSARLVLAYRKGRNLAPHMERLIQLIKEHINKT